VRRTLAVVLVVSAVAGCAVTQPAPPALDLPPSTASAADNALLARWWTAFDDPVLDALVAEAVANNLDLAAALARIEAARALLTLAQSYLYPDIHARAGASRDRQSQLAFQNSGNPVPIAAGNDLSLTVEASYEIDLWGKYRSGTLAAENDVAAARYDHETVRITVIADLASAYFRLRAADALLAVYEDTRKSRADTVVLQRDRFDAGLIGEYDLRQAQAELAAVDADIARTRQARPRRRSRRSPGVRRAGCSRPQSRAARRSRRRPRCRRCRRACRRGSSRGAPTSAAPRRSSRPPNCGSSRRAPTTSRR